MVILISSILFLEFGSFVTIKGYQYMVGNHVNKKESQINNTDEVKVNNAIQEAKEFLKEAKKFSPYQYHAFIGWKHPDVASPVINIRDSIRQTSANPNWNGENNIWFFGGSTIWGSHVSDSGTVPSMTTKIPNHFRSINLGEQSYNSRQELNLLINYLDKIKSGDQVVFYDGVNDIYTNCDARNGLKGHSRVRVIRELLLNKDSLLYPLAGLIKKSVGYINNIVRGSYSQELATAISLRLFGPNENNYDELTEHYICDDDRKAYEVAEFIVNSWRTAETLIHDRGGKMLCILQPNPYTFKGDSKVIPRLPWKSATEAVYPKIRELGKELNCFRDMSDVFEQDYYLDDCCHVSREGNYEIAKNIMMYIKNRL